MRRDKAAALLRDLWERLWATGVSDPLIVIEQISYFMLLKALDLDERTGARDLATPPIFEGRELLHWDSLRQLPDLNLVNTLEAELIPLLASAGGPAFSAAMSGGRLLLDDPELVRSCISTIDLLDLEGHEPAYRGEVYEELLALMQLSGRGGQTRTPPRLAQTMIELVDPQPGQAVCDPAAGTAELLVAAAQHLKALGDDPPSERLRGFDINAGLVRVGAMNMLFHGIGDPAIKKADTLSKRFERVRSDVVVAIPPFGKVLSRGEVHPKLTTAGTRTELLFTELCRQLLRPAGRAAILVPESVLFGQSPEFVRVRRQLLQRGSVQAIIPLPPGVLEPYATIRTAIILICARGMTEAVWFCPADESGEGRRSRRKGANDSQLAVIAPAVLSRLAGAEPDDAEAKALATRMWSAGIAKIEEENWSLSPATYRSPEASEQSLRDPLEVLEEAEQLETEIDQRLSEARRILRNMP